MWKKFIEQPDFEFVGQEQYPSILKVTYLVIAVVGVLLALVNFQTQSISENSILLFLSVASLAGFFGVNSRYRTLISYAMPVFVLVILLFLLTKNGGIHDPAVMGYPIIVVFTTLLLGKRTLPYVVFLVLLALFVQIYGEVNGFTDTPFSAYTDIFDFLTISILILATARFLWVIMQNLELNARNAKTAEQKWRVLVENAPAIVINTNLAGEIVFINISSFANSRDLVGTSIYELFDGASRQTLEAAVKNAVAERNASILELPVSHPATDRHWYSIRIGVSDALNDGPGLIFILSEITDRIEWERSLEHQATHDNLTGLPNRMLFTDRLLQAIKKSKRKGHHLAVAFLDLNDFKFINDSYGHEFGDLVLQVIGKRIKSALRASDSAGRMGGDEFAIIIDDLTDQNDVELVIKRLMSAIAEPIFLNGNKVKVTCSIGVSLFSRDGQDASELIRNADIAMHNAKTFGGNRFQFYSEKYGYELKAEINIKNQLQQALETNSFHLVFQPQLDLEKRAIVGVEALLRLVSPSKKIIPPLDFIDVAEKSGLIVDIGKWVIETACEAQVQLRAQLGADLRLAINLSPREWQDENLIETIEAAIKKFGANPEFIEFEITESSMFQNLEQSLAHMKKLRKLGARLLVDDFGTGYSSLSYLWQFPISGIKLDRAFTLWMGLNAQMQVIVTGIVDIAKKLGLDVVVEGLETKESVEQFREMGCNIVQGYHLSKPLPYPELVEFVKKWEKSYLN